VEVAMKNVLGAFLLIAFLCSIGFSQRTENASNLILNFTGTASQDTLKSLSSYKANLDSALVKYVVRVVVSAPVNRDSIFIWEATNPSGARYLAKIIIDSVALSPKPFFLELGCKIDSGFVIIRRYKQSNVSIIYRVGY
jgi:hypothetical protein